MANLPQNSIYGAMTGAAYSLGQSANKVAPKLDPRKFTNLTSSMKYGPTTTTPSNISGLMSGNITVPYGGRTRYERFHPGVDIANEIGTPIQSFAGGTVTEAVGGKRKGNAGFGNYVIITDDNGNKWRYSHLANEYVKVGQRVGTGQQIGAMGNTGQTYSLTGGTGSHLDLRLQNAAGKYLNPLTYTTK